ncbi:MAG: DUF523 domain-containing protein [Proteobacteria bacterium]|nr:DUF523 domain-containing protein [Pseudomonadota bacterium]MBU1714871.1 DUF523 domain-containing protein [Pseudomonadota bacterium]
MSEKKNVGGDIYLVSSCLVGLCTRYDGRVKENVQCMKALAGKIWIPVCPEQLGGLPTPRRAADLVGGDGAAVLAGRARVVNRDGIEVSGQFIKGAQQVLAIAESQPITGIFLKARSPSCGVGEVLGVTAALLQSKGYVLREF